MTVVSPGTQQPIVQTDQRGQIDSSGVVDSTWYVFFQGLLNGDVGTAWTPVPTSLSFSGSAPAITGFYYQNQGFTDFWIRIIPSSGGNVSATAGTSYFDLPFTVSQDTHCTAVSGFAGALGMIDANTKRAYIPTLLNVTNPITITGRVVSQ